MAYTEHPTDIYSERRRKTECSERESHPPSAGDAPTTGTLQQLQHGTAFGRNSNSKPIPTACSRSMSAHAALTPFSERTCCE
jgi:hypothetical protein